MGAFYKIALEINGVSRLKIYWSPVLHCFISGFNGDEHYILVREADFLIENYSAECHAKKIISRLWSYDVIFERVEITPAQFTALKLIST